MTLYEIDNAILEAVDGISEVFDEETGEVTDIDTFEALKAKFDGLQMARNEKISNIACLYKSLLAEAEAIKKEKQALAKRQTSAENRAESVKKYLDYALHGEKFKDARNDISYRKSESVVLDPDLDPFDLPIQFRKVSFEANKTELKKAIKNGQKITGVALEVKSNIQIK